MSAGTAVHWDLRPGADWPAVAPLWDRLNGVAGGLPFFAAEFVAPLLEHFGRGDEIVAIARRGDRPVAGAILAPAGRGRVATFQPAQMPLIEATLTPFAGHRRQQTAPLVVVHSGDPDPQSLGDLPDGQHPHS